MRTGVPPNLTETTIIWRCAASCRSTATASRWTRSSNASDGQFRRRSATADFLRRNTILGVTKQGVFDAAHFYPGNYWKPEKNGCRNLRKTILIKCSACGFLTYQLFLKLQLPVLAALRCKYTCRVAVSFFRFGNHLWASLMENPALIIRKIS